MKPVSEVTACVVDKGLFTHIALCMAEQCKRVYYTGPPEQVMRRLQDDVIGDGFENIIRIESLWDVEDECDIFVFPDIGFGGEQKKLKRDGRNVFGHMRGDCFEVMKGQFLDKLEDLDMEVPPHEVVIGFDALIEHLKDKKEKWIKLSKWRGDWETFKWRNPVLDLTYLIGHPLNRCPLRNALTFYVFDKIDSPIEDGIDSCSIDGRWPKTVLHAMEKKDKSLIGGMQLMSDISPEIRRVNEKWGPVLGKFGYRGFFSTEVRPPNFIDPTCRAGSPPSQLQTALIKNLPEVIYGGALGEVVEPEFDDVMGAQVLVTTDKEKEDWLTFDMPDELREHVKASFCFEFEGRLCLTPNLLENCAGWLVATGKDIAQVVERLKELKSLLPDGFDCDITSLSDLLDEIEKAKEHGIELPDSNPPPAEVLLEN